MPTSHSEDDVKLAKISAMGAVLGELHFLLWKDLTWLHFEWQQYVELFGFDESRIEIMNESAPRFFWSLDRVLWQDVLLSISRLSDPTASRGQQHLTLRRLLSAVRPDGPVTALREALDSFEHAASFARAWRHSIYAHRALGHATSPEAHPLPSASRESVIEALEAAGRAMNVVELHYEGSTMDYDGVSDPIGGAADLLYYLNRGLDARKADEDDDQPWEPRFR